MTSTPSGEKTDSKSETTLPDTESEKKKDVNPKWKPLEPNEHYYKANLSFVQKNAPGLLPELQGHEDLEIPVEDDINVQGVKNPICTVLIGFSQRHIADQILNHRFKDCKHLIIVEPDLAVFNATLKRVYIADLLENPRVDFIVGVTPDDVKTQLFQTFTDISPKFGSRASTSQSPEVITDPFLYGSGGVKEGEGEAFIKSAIDTSRQAFLAMGCAADSFNRYEQTIRNLDTIDSAYQIGELFNKFKNRPAIVVGAGPSLDEFMSLWKENKLEKKALIIACDAALVKLLDAGIRPHFVTRCERKLSTIFEGAENYDLKGIYYAAYPWCPPEYFELFPDAFMLFRDNGVCKWTGYKPGSVNGGVSSANAALELALMFGCSDIVLAGIDLAMGEDGATHCAGTQVEFDPNKSKKEGKWEEVEGNTLEKVTTIPVWKRCLQEYSHSIFKWEAKGVKPSIYNISRIGAKVPGAPYVPQEEVVKLLDKEWNAGQVIKSNLVTPPSEYKVAHEKNVKATLELLKSFITDTKKLLLFLDDAMINCAREEFKTMEQTRAQHTPSSFFEHYHANKKSLTGMYKGQCSQIDSYKQKYFGKREFCDLIIDCCQLETFQMENKMNSLKNLVELEYERMKAYITLHYSLFVVYLFYAEKMQTIMSGTSLGESGEELVLEHNAKVTNAYLGNEEAQV